MDDKKQAGFSVAIILIAIIILAILGYGGYRFYSYYNKPAAANSVGTSQTANPAQTQTTDPYAGWKTYCDTIEKACFKYPADWTIDSSSQDGIASAIVKNPGGSVVADYASSDTRDGTEVVYYTASIDDAVAAPQFKIVGGFLSASTGVTPRYKVVDQPLTTSLVVDQQTTVVNTARFTFKDHITGHLEAYPINTNFDTNQAKAWFSSDDAKTVRLIERSFYLQ